LTLESIKSKNVTFSQVKC